MSAADQGPDDGAVVLAALNRYRKGDPQDAPGERLMLREKVWQGARFFDLRVFYRTATGAYQFTSTGTSIRRHEAPEIIASLWKSLDAEGRERVKKYLRTPPSACAVDSTEGTADR